jgi:hypothetical protein
MSGRFCGVHGPNVTISRVIDEQLSAAVLAYVYGGSQGRLYPSSNPEAVVEAFGDAALDLLPRIYAITALIDAITEAEWSTFTGTLAEMAARIEAEVAEVNPELDADAVRALSNQWAFAHK